MRAWPFLISASKRREYRCVVAPDPLEGAGHDVLAELGRRVGGRVSSESKHHSHKFEYNDNAGVRRILYLTWRTVPATSDFLDDGPGVSRVSLTDNLGRPIEFVEGMATDQPHPVTSALLDDAHRQLLDPFRRFWHAIDWQTEFSLALSAEDDSKRDQATATLSPATKEAFSLSQEQVFSQSYARGTPDRAWQWSFVRTLHSQRGATKERPISLKYLDWKQLLVTRSANHAVAAMSLYSSEADLVRLVSATQSGVRCPLSVDPAGQRFATAFGRVLAIWETNTLTREEKDVRDHRGPILFAQLLGGDRLLTIDDHACHLLWERSTLRQVVAKFPYKIRDSWLSAYTPTAFATSSEMVAVGDRKGVVHVLKSADFSESYQLSFVQQEIQVLSFSRDSERLLVGREGKLFMWRLGEQKPPQIANDRSNIVFAGFRPARSHSDRNQTCMWIAHEDGQVRALSEDGDRELARFQVGGGSLTALEISADGDLIFAASAAGEIELWQGNYRSSTSVEA
jgi:hypothetical protein